VWQTGKEHAGLNRHMGELLPTGDLERQIEAIIAHYNHPRTLQPPGHG
jgi:hypothetical protein